MHFVIEPERVIEDRPLALVLVWAASAKTGVVHFGHDPCCWYVPGTVTSDKRESDRLGENVSEMRVIHRRATLEQQASQTHPMCSPDAVFRSKHFLVRRQKLQRWRFVEDDFFRRDRIAAPADLNGPPRC